MVVTLFQLIQGLKLNEVVITPTERKKLIVSPSFAHGAIFQEVTEGDINIRMPLSTNTNSHAVSILNR